MLFVGGAWLIQGHMRIQISRAARSANYKVIELQGSRVRFRVKLSVIYHLPAIVTKLTGCCGKSQANAARPGEKSKYINQTTIEGVSIVF